ncbi:MAG: thiamine-monophosphate kinase [Planctomycetes bacterium]|nr:thiamine-monophosphate kinase [Planctomycetota bacterium]
MAADDELTFLRWLARSDRPHDRLVVPIGDDGAVWRLDGEDRLVLAADALCEGSHFTADTAPHLVGRKALAVNLSDLAAMGARPQCALATAALPRGFDGERARAVTEGMRDLAAVWDCPLVGGDTVTHDGGLVLSVSVVGTLMTGEPITRTGSSVARPGDLIAVTGRLGGSGGGRHLTFTPRLRESARLVELGPPDAMIDVSDGLLLDLYRLDTAARFGFRLDLDAIPVHDDADLDGALSDGEDFELLFTAPADVMTRILDGWDLETSVTVIGEIATGGGVLVRDGREEPAPPLGFRHE